MVFSWSVRGAKRIPGGYLSKMRGVSRRRAPAELSYEDSPTNRYERFGRRQKRVEIRGAALALPLLSNSVFRKGRMVGYYEAIRHVNIPGDTSGNRIFQVGNVNAVAPRFVTR